jgi:hypothetical protein
MSSSQILPESVSNVVQDLDIVQGSEQITNEDAAATGMENRDTTLDAPIHEVVGIQEEPITATQLQHTPAEPTEVITASTAALDVDDQAKVDKLDKNSVATTLTSWSTRRHVLQGAE